MALVTPPDICYLALSLIYNIHWVGGQYWKYRQSKRPRRSRGLLRGLYFQYWPTTKWILYLSWLLMWDTSLHSEHLLHFGMYLQPFSIALLLWTLTHSSWTRSEPNFSTAPRWRDWIILGTTMLINSLNHLGFEYSFGNFSFFFFFFFKSWRQKF